MTQNKKISCLVIDDEPPARDILVKHIAGVESLELAGECSNAIEALSVLQNNPVDLLFLDIQMPHILGTSFIRTLKNPPKVIFTTAYRKFAIQGFELNAVDYLLKPISFERFLQAVNKILQINLTSFNNIIETAEATSEQAPPFLYFRADRKMVKIYLDDILFVESVKDYIKIYTADKTIFTKHTISSLEEMLPSDMFIRIHRSYIVAISKIDTFNVHTIGISKKDLPIGRLFKHDVNKLLASSAAIPPLPSINTKS